MNVPYDIVIRWLEEDDQFRRYVEDKYKTEYQYYRRFRDKNGTRCPIARSAARRIFEFEFAIRGTEFTELVQSGVWRAAGS